MSFGTTSAADALTWRVPYSEDKRNTRYFSMRVVSFTMVYPAGEFTSLETLECAFAFGSSPYRPL